jgi:hypothetical protein
VPQSLRTLRRGAVDMSVDAVGCPRLLLHTGGVTAFAPLAAAR